MKKTIAVFILLASLLLVSCGKGASVSYNEIRRRLDPATVFADGRSSSFTEVLTFFGNDGKTPAYSYSVCLFPSDDKAYEYGVVQSDGNFSLYAVDGRVFTKKDGKTYSLILMSQTYREYIDGYLSCENDFDRLSYRQLSSKKYSGGKTEVSYSADMTIALAAKYSSLGFSVGDMIIATYEIHGDHITDKVTYSLKKSDGTEKPFLCREFSYSEKLPELPVPAPDTAKVTVIFNYGAENETRSVFHAQKGCFLGISRGSIKSTFYTDAALSSVFSPDETLIEGDITLYAAGN